MAKSVTVHYRRLVGGDLGDLDFRESFEAGLNGQIGGVRIGAEDRIRITTSNDEKRMCLLTPEITDHFCFGEIAVFKEGDVPIAEMEAGGQVVLRTIQLGGNEEAIRGSSYFMARGPHIALVHHDSSTRFVLDYVSWLFHQPIGNIPADEIISLQPLINVGGRPVALREVKSLKIRAEVEALPHFAFDDAEFAEILGELPGRPQTFRRLIDRRSLTGANFRAILSALGMTNGTLEGFNDADLQDLEFELLVKKRENNRIADLPDELIQGVVDDGLDRAAEFQTAGARRRGNGAVASFAGDVEVDGAYYELPSVRALLWAALGEWANQGLI